MRITLQAPPANTYSHAMMRQLDEAILDARFNDDVEVIILTGAGEKFFCAGADIGMLQDAEPRFKYQFCLHANETLLRLEHTPKVVIAAINGHCVGGGLEVAMACDLRVAMTGSYKLGLPEMKLGVLPGTGGTARLTRLVGKTAALDMMLHSDMFGPQEALDKGIVSRVFEAENVADFQRQALAMAQNLASPNQAALAGGLIKRSVQSGADLGLEQHLALERELQQRLFTSEDAKEGIRSFQEKRPPAFTGR
ncbi:MAG: enoyl-CoA hydratase [Myxococcales bacterium]|nr:enoyl-CoA hydratase [Myxococcales bacterium]